MKTYTKFNVSENEYCIYKHVYDLNIVNIPKPIYYDKTKKMLTTELIDSLNIADEYSDDPNKVPDYIYSETVNVIKLLSSNGIIYPDITGYNFIHHYNKIWIVDFEHTYFNNEIDNSFVSDFCNWTNKDDKKWNPDFK